MPGIPGWDPLDPTANLHREAKVSVGLVAHNGIKYSVNVPGLGGAVDLVVGEKMALADAIGAVSNMGVYRVTEGKVNDIRIADAVANDEAHSDPSNVLSMTFENDNLEKIVIDIPAPDATLFAGDGVTLLDRTDATVGTLIGDLIDAAEQVINSTYAPANSFEYVRGVLRTRKVKLPTGMLAVPTVQEGSGATAGPAT